MQDENKYIDCEDEGVSHYCAYGFWTSLECTIHQVAEDGACALRSMFNCVMHNKHDGSKFGQHGEQYWVAMSIEYAVTDMLWSGGDKMSKKILKGNLHHKRTRVRVQYV